MTYERKRDRIVITPENDSDEAFSEDTLGLKPGDETRAVYIGERRHLGGDKKALVILRKNMTKT